MKYRSPLAVVFALLSTLSLQPSTLHAQGTAFTYQGRLNNSGTPANGLYDFRFKLATDPLANNYVGGDSFATNTPVTNGLFLATIDFGRGIFAGSNYWLEVDVRTNNPANILTYTGLMPLQAVTPVPYAIMANNASNLLGALSASQLSGAFPSQLSGTIPLAQLPGAVVTNNEANVMLDNVTVSDGLTLPATAVIYSGNNSLVYSDGNNNFFAGLVAGNFIMSGVGNTGVGFAALNDNSSGLFNTANGVYALYANTTGYNNTASGADTLFSNTNGYANTADGAFALYNNTLGSDNTAVGNNALGSSPGGEDNTAIGYQSLYYNTNGYDNVAVGSEALFYVTNDSRLVGMGYQALENDNASGQGSGSDYGENTAIGYQALQLNTLGYDNTAIGYQSLIHNTNGIANTAIGSFALSGNTSGGYNVANGYLALYNNTNGDGNTANGAEALHDNTSGNYNTADGFFTLFGNTSGSDNTAIGYSALENTAGSNNISMGYLAGQNLLTGNNNIYIGSPGTNLDSGIIRIGTPGIQTKTYLIGTVYANNVQLTSDRNAKENFTGVKACSVLAKVAALPISEWNYKTDSKEVQHIGPMAQDFYAAFGLDGTDDKHISVVDEGGVALAAIQGLNQKLEEKDAKINELEKRLNDLQQMVQALAARK